MSRRLLAEFLGTAGLLIVVVGSGIMGESLAGGNAAIALLANSLATGAGLYALIQTFGQISGAHFNPVVSFVEFLWKRMSAKELIGYISVQVVGALAGVWLTHLMFGQQILQLSTHDRREFRFDVSEVIATFGLLMVIALSGKKNVETTPAAVALFITSAYWCTSSTSFANPAVTIARSLTNTFTGILWTGAAAFIAAQLIGAVLAFYVSARLLRLK
jgi:glycerol uptake facilitator-like aquaporin